jgi:hypothetical protein
MLKIRGCGTPGSQLQVIDDRAASDSCREHRDPSGEEWILETHPYITAAFFRTQDATVHQRSQRPANR